MAVSTIHSQIVSQAFREEVKTVKKWKHWTEMHAYGTGGSGKVLNLIGFDVLNLAELQL